MSLSQFSGGGEIIWRQFLQQFGKVVAGKWGLTKLPGTANDKRMSLHGVRPILPKCRCAPRPFLKSTKNSNLIQIKKEEKKGSIK